MSGFSLVKAPIQSKTRSSALYNYLQIEPNKRKTRQELQKYPETIQILTPDAAKNRNYYLIGLSLDTAELQKNLPDFTGYNLIERHLRIDECFDKFNTQATDGQLLSHWHYTETYTNTAKQTISVRLYFHYTNFINAYITIGDAAPQLIKSMTMINNGQHNSAAAQFIIISLLEKMYDLKEKLDQQLANIITKFEIKNIKNISESFLTAELEQATAISNQLNSLLEDYTDKRIEILTKAAHKLFIANNSLTIETTVDDELDATIKEEISTSAASASAAATTPEPNIPITIETIHKQVGDLIRTHRAAASLDEYLAVEQQRQDLQDTIITYYVTIPNNDTTTTAKLLKLNDIMNSMDCLHKRFLKFIDNLQIDQAILLFKFVQSNIHPSYYLDLIANAASQPLDLSTEQKYIQLFSFMHKHSTDFKYYASLIGHLTFSYKVSISNVDQMIGITVPFQIALNSNFELFKFLIELSNNYHINAVTVNSLSIPMFNMLLNYIEDNRFAELFIDSGHNIKSLQTSRSLLGLQMHALGKIRKNNLNLTQGVGTLSNMMSSVFKQAYPNTAFYSYCSSVFKAEKRSDKLLTVLLEDNPGNLELVLGASRYTFDNSLSSIGATEDMLGIKIYGILDAEESSKEMNCLNLKNPKTNARYINYCIIKINNKPHTHRTNLIINKFNMRFSVLKDIELQKIYNQLSTYGEDQLQKQQNYNALTAFKAMLLVSAFFEPTYHNHLKAFLSLSAISRGYNLGFNEENINTILYANYGLNFVKVSLFKDQLEEHQSYKMLAASLSSVTEQKNKNKLVLR